MARSDQRSNNNLREIKITTDYNKNCVSDFTINNLKTIISDRELLNKIINTTTINYTEIQ